MDGFEIVEGKRGRQSELLRGEVIPPQSYLPAGIGADKMLGAVADNFDKILRLASDIVSIQKMHMQSDIVIKQMREAREQLLAETKCYAEKKDADTKSVVEKMKVIRDMMNDFYQHASQNLTSEDFSKIITEVVNQMGKMENNG